MHSPVTSIFNFRRTTRASKSVVQLGREMRKSRGVPCKQSCRNCSTAGVMAAGRPERGASNSPRQPWSRNRRSQWRTVSSLWCVMAAISATG
jgi:hypothetical protein